MIIRLIFSVFDRLFVGTIVGHVLLNALNKVCWLLNWHCRLVHMRSPASVQTDLEDDEIEFFGCCLRECLISFSTGNAASKLLSGGDGEVSFRFLFETRRSTNCCALRASIGT